VSRTTQIRVYESDKERIDRLKDDMNIPTLISKALDEYEEKNDV